MAIMILCVVIIIEVVIFKLFVTGPMKKGHVGTLKYTSHSTSHISLSTGIHFYLHSGTVIVILDKL